MTHVSADNAATVKAILRGHSGAHVAVHQDGQRAFVRKMAGREELNGRLEAQCAKQRHFGDAGIVCAQVLGQGMHEDLFYFDMAYVPGTTVAADCTSGALLSLNRFCPFLEDWLSRLTPTIDGVIKGRQLKEKISSVARNSLRNPVLEARSSQILSIAERLNALSWPDIPASECHGDFTLENMLLGTDGRIHLIDFDAPDISSLWMDVGKMYQDLIGHWCIRRLGVKGVDTLEYGTAAQGLYRLQSCAEAIVERLCPGIGDVLAMLAALNLLRTLPYSQDDAVADFTIRRILHLLRRM